MSPTYFLFCILILCGLVQLITWWFRRRYMRQQAAKCPGPPALPLVGNGLLFAGSNYDILNVVDHLFQNYDSSKLPIRVWLGPKLYFFTSNPDHFDLILNSVETLGKDDRYKFVEKWIGAGLFSAPVQTWRRHRKVISPTFNQRILDTFTPVFVDQGLELVEQLTGYADGRTFDIFQHINRCTLDIICETAMGVTVDAQKSGNESEYIKASQKFLELLMQRMFQIWKGNPIYFKLSGLQKEETKCLKVLHDFSRKVVDEKIQVYQESCKFETKFGRKPFLDQLIEATQGTTECWTPQELQEEVDTMIIAGSDTSGTMACFILMVLGIRKDIQNKLIEETRLIYGDSGRQIVVEDLQEMKYLELVIKETMRLFPVGAVIVRKASADLKFNDEFTFPSGAGVLLGIRTVQRDPKFWGEDAKEFIPERFLPENSFKRHPYAYVPFSGGPRNCVGQRYAMMSMKVLVISVLRYYEIGCPYNSIDDIALKADILLRPVNGFLITLKPRVDKI